MKMKMIGIDGDYEEIWYRHTLERARGIATRELRVGRPPRVEIMVVQVSRGCGHLRKTCHESYETIGDWMMRSIIKWMGSLLL